MAVFWCTKSVKFHFRWGTKQPDQKQDTRNDCDIISGLEALRKTDFSVIFWLWDKKVAKKWYKSALFKMSEKSVFPETLSPEMTSQSFSVARFWSRGFVPHRKWNLTLLVHQNIGKENRYRKTFFCYSYQYIVETSSSKLKKICHIHFKLLANQTTTRQAFFR